MPRSPPRSPPGAIPLSIPKTGGRQHPRCAPSRPRTVCGATDGLQRLPGGGAGWGQQLWPIPSPSLADTGWGTYPPPALGTPRPAAGPASPMSERGGSHLKRGRRCHGDAQTKPSSCLQAEAPPWTKRSEHLLQPHPRGPGGLHALGPCSLQGAARCWGRIEPFPLAGTRLHCSCSHSRGALAGQCRWALLGHKPCTPTRAALQPRAGTPCCWREPFSSSAQSEHMPSIAPVRAAPTGARISAGR